MNHTSERPPGFTYRSRKSQDSVLCCESVTLPTLAEKFGTPLYVYSAKAIRERVSAFQKAFREVDHAICYSVKANSNLSVLRLLGKAGCGFDVVSGGELERVLHVDRRSAKKVVFSGVGKTPDEITKAIKAGILLFNLESESELEVVAGCAARLKRTAAIAFRVNPDVPAETHPYISTGLRKHKFGVPIDEVRDLYARAASKKFLRVAGVSVHIGSQITNFAPFGAAMERVANLVNQLRRDGHKIEYVDAGGGLGIDYNGQQDFATTVSEYARAIARPLEGLNVKVLLEPGRSIVGPAGVLLTRVLYRKENGGKKFVIVDAAMNDLIRPSLYQAEHQIVPVNDRKAAQEPVDVVGPVCESGDFFARDRGLASTIESDLLAILDAGAYGMTLASNYNTRPRAAEVMIDGKSANLIRRRETIADLLRAETMKVTQRRSG
ncbi:MAG TPA: diaminopimelate decarboxylase [Terriglobales bacterium]|nr:diaminopimelate decarboxylase [Terriglobales bacterium]